MQYEAKTSGLSRQRWSIGTGKRSDFTKSPCRNLYLETNPAPTDYKEQPGIASKKNHGWKVAASRGVSEAVSPRKQGSPGPGAYNYSAGKAVGQEGAKYSMRMKTSMPRGRLSTPGPGTYTPKEALDGVGRYSISKYPSTGAPVISPAKDRLNSSFDTPGPGAYEPKTGLSATGQYFLTNLRNVESRSFAKAVRPGFPVVQYSTYYSGTPGPGAYRNTSEFGLYESHLSNNASKQSINQS